MSSFSYYSEDEHQEVISVLLGNAGPFGYVFASLFHKLGQPYDEHEYILDKVSVVTINRHDSDGFCCDSTAPGFRQAVEVARKIVQATPSFNCAQYGRRPLGRWKTIKLNRLAYSVFAGLFDGDSESCMFRPIDVSPIAGPGYGGLIGALAAGKIISNVYPFAEIASMNYRRFIESTVELFRLGRGFDSAVIYCLGWFATACWGLFNELRSVTDVVVRSRVDDEEEELRRPREQCGHFVCHQNCVHDQFSFLDEEWAYTGESALRINARVWEVPPPFYFESLPPLVAGASYSADWQIRMTQC